MLLLLVVPPVASLPVAAAHTSQSARLAAAAWVQGSTSGESLFNARAFNPRLQYVLGANFGLPTGFALATEAGKK
jgi:hypothetical protein